MGSTSTSAASTLYVRGHVELTNPDAATDAEGNGQVEISVRKIDDRIKLTVSLIVGTKDDDAAMTIEAALDPADFAKLVGFERAITLMGHVHPAPSATFTGDQQVCAIERIYSDAVERLGMKRRVDVETQRYWHHLMDGARVEPTVPDTYSRVGLYQFGSDSEADEFAESMDGETYCVMIGSGESRGHVSVNRWPGK